MTFQHERFRDLIAVVEAVPEKQFDMNFWMRQRHACRTVGCAAGWYAITYPERCHIRFDVLGFSDLVAGDGGIGAYSFIQRHFGIATLSAYQLFAPGSYSDPRKCVVLARLIRFYNDHCPADARLPEVSSEIPEEREKEAEPVQVQDGSTVSRSGHGSTTRSCPDFSIPV